MCDQVPQVYVLRGSHYLYTLDSYTAQSIDIGSNPWGAKKPSLGLPLGCEKGPAPFQSFCGLFFPPLLVDKDNLLGLFYSPKLFHRLFAAFHYLSHLANKRQPISLT